MTISGKTVEALLAAQKAAELLRRYQDNKNALQRPPDVIGKDESSNSELLKNLADFISDQEIETQEKPKKKVSIAAFRKRLAWLYDMIDEGMKRGKFKTTGNSFQVGRFYTFNYVPRHKEKLPIWDARPVILCLDANYMTHFFKKGSKNVGVLGVNWHYVPMANRKKIMKQLIHDHSGNRANFINNSAIDISVIESLHGVYNAFPKFKALRQYLRAGKYTDDKNKIVIAGAFNVAQIPYRNLTEILEVPSIYDAAFVGG